jgi:prevent-host-death family protein
MRPVQIAELKNNLSGYLHKVRGGEEVIICDRKSPIAKIVPLSADDSDLEDQALIAAGLLLPPKTRFDADAFFTIGKGLRRRPGTGAAIDGAMAAEREGSNVSLLGRKRTRSRVRARSNQ